MKIPLSSCKLYAKIKETYHENQQNEIFKIRGVQSKICFRKGAHPIASCACPEPESHKLCLLN